MAPRITSSKIERAEACPYSAAGTGVDTSGRWAERGTGVHFYLPDAYHRGREAALQEIPRDASHRKLCERIELEDLPWWHGKLPADAVVYFEASVSFDPESREAAQLPSGQGREAYDALPEWSHAGSSDVVVDIPSEDRVDVYDVKTGASIHVTRPQDNPQLHSYAVMFARALGRSKARIHITNLYEDGGAFTPTGHDLDAIDLHAFEARIVRTIARSKQASVAADPRPFMKRGSHCRYCPRFTECPAQLQVFRALIQGVVGKQSTAITPHDVKDARSFLRDAKQWIDELEGTIKEYARVESVPTDRPGVVYREVVGSQREILDHRVALRVLGQKYGAEVQEAATVSETSLGAIEEAVKAYAKANGRKAAPTVREAMDALRSEGALGEKETRSVKETKDAA